MPPNIKINHNAVRNVLRSKEMADKALLPAARKIQQRAGSDTEVTEPFAGKNRGRVLVQTTHPVGDAGKQKLKNAVR